jgi:hypothetical protein
VPQKLSQARLTASTLPSTSSTAVCAGRLARISRARLSSARMAVSRSLRTVMSRCTDTQCVNHPVSSASGAIDSSVQNAEPSLR